MGYVVPSREAILALEKRDAKAAKWWRKHTPHMLEPARNFIFSRRRVRVDARGVATGAARCGT